MEIHLDYMIKKIKDEYEYYLFLLNTTTELGLSSKNAIIDLYDKIKKKINETIFYLFQDDINFYLDLFYRENKKMFRNNFLNYYFRNNNEYETVMCKLDKFADEFIMDLKFNQTLDNISNHLIKDIVIKRIEEKINDSINTKIQNLYNIVGTYKNNLVQLLDNIQTRPLPPDMNN